MIMPADSKPHKSILIVDNNVHETEILHDWFRRNGFHVDVVTSSLDAVSRVRNTSYQFVFIDMDIEGELGGFETIWLMKTIVNGTRIALLSKDVTQEYQRKAASYGVLHWVHKPFDKRNTYSEINQLLIDNESKPNLQSWQIMKKFLGSVIRQTARR